MTNFLDGISKTLNSIGSNVTSSLSGGRKRRRTKKHRGGYSGDHLTRDIASSAADYSSSSMLSGGRRRKRKGKSRKSRSMSRSRSRSRSASRSLARFLY